MHHSLVKDTIIECHNVMVYSHKRTDTVRMEDGHQGHWEDGHQQEDEHLQGGWTTVVRLDTGREDRRTPDGHWMDTGRTLDGHRTDTGQTPDGLPVHFRSTSRPLDRHWTDTDRLSQNLRTDRRTFGRTEKNVTPKDPLRINARDLKIAF